jgi:hypothetical protein
LRVVVCRATVDELGLTTLAAATAALSTPRLRRCSRFLLMLHMRTYFIVVKYFVSLCYNIRVSI